MPLQELLDTLLDSVAIDSAGVKIGAVRRVYVDDGSGKATFAAVATGVFSSDAVVPLHGARLLDRELHVDHTRQSVRESPRQDDTDDGLTPDQEAELLEHYGVEAPVQPKAPAKTGSPQEEPAATAKPENPEKGTTPDAPGSGSAKP